MEPVTDRRVYRLMLPELDDGERDGVRGSLVDLPGVEDVRFALEGHEVVVTADPNVVSDDELLAAVGETGVEAHPA